MASNIAALAWDNCNTTSLRFQSLTPLAIEAIQDSSPIDPSQWWLLAFQIARVDRVALESSDMTGVFSESADNIATDYVCCVTTPSHWSPVPPSALRHMLSSSALQQVLLGGISYGWLVAEPFLITVELDEDGYYIASDDIFAVYGDGSTANEALQDYIVSLLDYYQLLSARAEDDPPTQVLFRRLQSFIRPVVQ